MLQEALLILLYVFLFSLIILKTNLFKSEYITRKFIWGVFITKVAASILYGHLCKLYNWNDTFVFFKPSKIIAKLFYHSPIDFLKVVFGPQTYPIAEEYVKIFGTDKIPYYGIGRSNFVVRINSLIQPFSNGHYNVHCVFFAFLSLMGIFYIYSFVAKKSTKNQKLLKFFVYFAPSILFWISGVHKDALITFGFGMILFCYNKIFSEKKPLFFIGLLLACAFCYLARNYTFLLFIPALITYTVVYYLKNIKPIYTHSLFILGGIIVFFAIPLIHPKLDFLDDFVKVQNYFLNLKGGSSYKMPPLEPNTISFLKAFPRAIWNSIIRPNFSSATTSFYHLSALENTLYILAAIISLPTLNYKRLNREEKNVVLMCLGFGFFFLTLLGLTVTNVGALVRYKSLPLLFIGMAFILLFDKAKFKTIYLNNKIYKKWQSTEKVL